MDVQWVDHHSSVGGATLVDFEADTPVGYFLARVKRDAGGYTLLLRQNGIWEPHPVLFRNLNKAKATGTVLARMGVEL